MTANFSTIASISTILLSLGMMGWLFSRVRKLEFGSAYGSVNRKKSIQAQMVFIIPIFVFIFFLIFQFMSQDSRFLVSPFITLIVLCLIFRQIQSEPNAINIVILKYSLWLMLVPAMEAGAVSTKMF